MGYQGDAKCNKCRYQGRVGDRIICDYMQVTGRARILICPPGDGCTVFERGAYQKKTGKGLPIVAETMTVKTDREWVEELVREGKNNKEIVELTGLPIKTVQNHKYRMNKSKPEKGPLPEPSQKAIEQYQPPPDPSQRPEGRPWIARLNTILDMAGQETDPAVKTIINMFARNYAEAQIKRELRP